MGAWAQDGVTERIRGSGSRSRTRRGQQGLLEGGAELRPPPLTRRASFLPSVPIPLTLSDSGGAL